MPKRKRCKATWPLPAQAQIKREARRCLKRAQPGEPYCKSCAEAKRRQEVDGPPRAVDTPET